MAGHTLRRPVCMKTLRMENTPADRPLTPTDTAAVVVAALACGLVEKTKAYALLCHSETNHLYDGQPYAVHLQMVYDYACKFSYLLPNVAAVTRVLAAAWTHDTIEDCRQSYNDVKAVCGLEIAEITFALTNEKGRTRKEMANEAYYRGIRETPYAGYVKLCDRLANVQYAKGKGHRMIAAYRNEQGAFQEALAGLGLQPMWEELSALLAED